jgi:hypothetical protein
MPVVYLSIEQFAEMAGLKPATLRNYRVAGLLPEPDVMVAQSPGWKPTTVQRWLKTRAKTTAR